MSGPSICSWTRGFRNAGLALYALVLALEPIPVEAHLVTTGLGPVYDGILHTLLSTEDLLSVLAMAMLAGLNGATAARRTLFALTVAWLVGGIAGFVVGQSPVSGPVHIVPLLVLGVLVAIDRRISATVIVSLCVAFGLFQGWLNGAGLAETQRDVLVLVGIVSAIFMLVTIAAAVVVSLRSSWMRIGVRTAGGWVAVLGLFMLGSAFS